MGNNATQAEPLPSSTAAENSLPAGTGEAEQLKAYGMTDVEKLGLPEDELVRMRKFVERGRETSLVSVKKRIECVNELARALLGKTVFYRPKGAEHGQYSATRRGTVISVRIAHRDPPPEEDGTLTCTENFFEVEIIPKIENGYETSPAWFPLTVVKEVSGL